MITVLSPLYIFFSLCLLYIRYIVYARSVGILEQLLERDQDREKGRKRCPREEEGRREAKGGKKQAGRICFQEGNLKVSLSPFLSEKNHSSVSLPHRWKERPLSGRERRAFKRIFSCLSARPTRRVWTLGMSGIWPLVIRKYDYKGNLKKPD